VAWTLHHRTDLDPIVPDTPIHQADRVTRSKTGVQTLVDDHLIEQIGLSIVKRRRIDPFATIGSKTCDPVPAA